MPILREHWTPARDAQKLPLRLFKEQAERPSSLERLELPKPLPLELEELSARHGRHCRIRLRLKLEHLVPFLPA